jgi:hypothetical protein
VTETRAGQKREHEETEASETGKGDKAHNQNPNNLSNKASGWLIATADLIR